MKIEDWRGRIDEIEEQLIRQLNERAKCALEIGKLKRKQGLPIRDDSREKSILNRVVQQNNGPLSETDIREIFATIIERTRELENLEHGGQPAK